MKLFVICSKRFYNRIPMIQEVLEELGHEVILPNCYDKPNTEDEFRMLGEEEHAKFKAAMYKQSETTIKNVDGVLVINLDKNSLKNYIGGATFLGMYDAFRFQKDIYLYNPVPRGILTDEIIGFNPTVINGNLNEIPAINKIQLIVLNSLVNDHFKTVNEITRNTKIDYDVCVREVGTLCEKGYATNEDMGDIYKRTDQGLDYVEKRESKQLRLNINM